MKSSKSSLILTFCLCFFIFFSCKNKSSDNNRNSEIKLESEFLDDDKTWDGTYCAEIEYYNPNTGTSSTYTLTIEADDNELEQINWPNGGYLDDFYSVEIDEDGYTTFTSDKGYDYTVQITGYDGDCFEDVPMASQCNGMTEDEEQCENMTDNLSGYCWQHEDQE